ncbi:MAG: hypothetical protein ACREVL_07660 [Solimonas sp.]
MNGKLKTVAAPLLMAAAGLLLAGCAAEAPKPMAPKNISAPLKPVGLLPPGLSSSLKEGDAVSLKVPTALRLHPVPNGDVEEQLPPGTLVKLKSRILNAVGPWWLVDTPHAAGWVAEAELLRK